MHLCPSVSASKAASSASAETFVCGKCGEGEPLGNLVPRGSQIWCRCCYNNYRTQCTRAASNPDLKKWFKSLSPDEDHRGAQPLIM